MVNLTGDYKWIQSTGPALTTQVFTGQCILKAIIVNNTSTVATQIIDGVSGTTSTVGVLKASIVEGTYAYPNGGVSMTNGIMIITGDVGDITVVYSAK